MGRNMSMDRPQGLVQLDDVLCVSLGRLRLVSDLWDVVSWVAQTLT